MTLQLVWCYDHDRLETIEEHDREQKVESDDS